MHEYGDMDCPSEISFSLHLNVQAGVWTEFDHYQHGWGEQAQINKQTKPHSI